MSRLSDDYVPPAAGGGGGSGGSLPVPKVQWGIGFDFGMDTGPSQTVDHTLFSYEVPFDVGYANDGVTYADSGPLDTDYMTWAGPGSTHCILKKDGWYLVTYEFLFTAPLPVSLGFGIDNSSTGKFFLDGNIAVGQSRINGNYMSYYQGGPSSGGELSLHIAGSGLTTDVTISYAYLGFTPLFAY